MMMTRLDYLMLWLVLSTVSSFLIRSADCYEFDINDGSKKVRIETDPAARDAFVYGGKNATEKSDFQTLPERFERLLVLRDQKLKELAAKAKSNPGKIDEQEESNKHIYITNINRNVNDFMEHANQASSSNSNSATSAKVANKGSGYHNIYMSNPEDLYRKLSHTLRLKAEDQYKQTHPSKILDAINKYDKVALANLAAGIILPEETETKPEPEPEHESSDNKFQPAQKLQTNKDSIKMRSSKTTSTGAKKASTAAPTPNSDTFIASKSDGQDDYHEEEFAVYD